MAASKAFILYVWDNRMSQVAAVYRAVGPGEGSQGPARVRLPLLERFRLVRDLIARLNARRMLEQPHPVFNIAKIGFFLEQLLVHYPDSRYAIRDWLASSLEDFFYSRYGWTAQEFERFRPRGINDPFDSPERSAEAIALCDYRRWMPSGCELYDLSNGSKPGLPNTDSPTADRFLLFSSSFLLETRNLVLGLLRKTPPEKIAGVILPPMEKELAALIASQGSYPVTFGDPKKSRGAFLCNVAGPGEGRQMYTFLPHRVNCGSVFTEEQLSSDFGVETGCLTPPEAAREAQPARPGTFLLYVWDNETLRVADVFRAIGPGKGAGGEFSPEDPVPQLFDIAKIRAFTERLKLRYPARRYAIRDWLANSLADFFSTRYRWGEDEFSEHHPRDLRDPFASGKTSAAPIRLCDFSLWMPSGVEKHSQLMGSKPGLPHDERRFQAAIPVYLGERRVELIREMTERGMNPSDESQRGNYLAELKKRGWRTYETAADMPRIFTMITTAMRVEARSLIFKLIDAELCPPERIIVPRHEKEVYALLAGKYSCPVVFNLHDWERNFYYETRKVDKDGYGICVMIGTHWYHCASRFYPNAISQDFG